MLNDILDLCIEKSDEDYLYSFRYEGVTRILTISKWKRLGISYVCDWSRDFWEGAITSALELMGNE